MFTGIIETTLELVEVKNIPQGRRYCMPNPWQDLQAGESIAVNGVCLTLLPGADNLMEFDLSPETLAKTTFSQLETGACLNVERAMKASDRFGGHYVSGHVDGTALVHKVTLLDGFLQLELMHFEDSNARLYLLEKGSLTVNGVSLTINAIDAQSDRISLMLVPHTLSVTNLGSLKEGMRVNIEFDYLTRIVAQQTRLVASNMIKGDA